MSTHWSVACTLCPAVGPQLRLSVGHPSLNGEDRWWTDFLREHEHHGPLLLVHEGLDALAEAVADRPVIEPLSVPEGSVVVVRGAPGGFHGKLTMAIREASGHDRFIVVGLDGPASLNVIPDPEMAQRLAEHFGWPAPPLLTNHGQITEDYGKAKDQLVEEAILLAGAGASERRYAAATDSPTNAVALVLDALWQRPQLARPLAAYFAARMATIAREVTETGES